MNDPLKYIKYLLLSLIVAGFLSCQQPGGNNPGSEYIPDMAHSVAYEANYYNYYYYNTWGSEDEYYQYAAPRHPVAGTVARGFAGDALGSTHDPLHKEVMHIRKNGSVPYYYGDSVEEKERATNEFAANPYPITTDGLVRGKELYDIFCGICHGAKGDGAGYLVREDGGKYPVQPANLLLPEFVSASNGRYYHTIMHGLNKMGAYKDKLDYEERWQVIHYIRSLQAKELKLVYDQLGNTLNDLDIPAGAAYSLNGTDHSEDLGMNPSDHDTEMHHDQGHGVTDDHNSEH